MDMPTHDLVEELKAAFPAKRNRWLRELVNSWQGDEPFRVAEAFADKDDWTALDSEWLDRVPGSLGSALSFLSNEAICFYIPAYISADLGGHLRRVTPDFHLTHGFDSESRHKRVRPDRDETWGQYASKRWYALNQPKCAAVAHYLEWVIARDGNDIATNALEALGTYWYPRAAGENPGDDAAQSFD